jgi:hypothetical protein
VKPQVKEIAMTPFARYAALAGAATVLMLGAATPSEAQYWSGGAYYGPGPRYSYAPAPYSYRPYRYRAYNSYAYAPRYRYVSPRYRYRVREDQLTGTGAGFSRCWNC